MTAPLPQDLRDHVLALSGFMPDRSSAFGSIDNAPDEPSPFISLDEALPSRHTSSRSSYRMSEGLMIERPSSKAVFEN